MNVGVIIQARMGSTRLPGKVLKPIAGKVLLDHVLGRLSLLAYPVKVVVATSDLPQDDAIVRHCQSRSVAVYRGSETDVLDRYYQCACENGFAHVVRLTADNPFTDVEELQRLIEQRVVVPLARWRVANPKVRNETLLVDQESNGEISIRKIQS